jgi:probable HAF family extracellular repeat protein
MRGRPATPWIAGSLLLSLSSAALANRYMLVDLGTRTSPSAVNRSGEAAGEANGFTNAAIWRNGRWHLLSQTGSHANAINGRGDAAGDEGVVPTLWLRKAGKRSIELPEGSQSGAVSAIAQDQTVVGSYYPYQANNAYHCFIAYPGGALQDLGLVGTGRYCGASDVNGAHQVVGSLPTTDNGMFQAFLWQDGQFRLLGILPGGDSSLASSINLRGDVVGMSSLGGSSWSHGVLWKDGAMIDIGTDARYTLSSPNAINDSGEIVGEARTLDATLRAVRFAEGRIIDLAAEVDDLGDWTLQTARSISNAGVIVGQASRTEIRHGKPEIREHGYMLVPLSAPGRSSEF